MSDSILGSNPFSLRPGDILKECDVFSPEINGMLNTIQHLSRLPSTNTVDERASQAHDKLRELKMDAARSILTHLRKDHANKLGLTMEKAKEQWLAEKTERRRREKERLKNAYYDKSKGKAAKKA